MERKLYSGEYADFNITCKKGAVFPVHKIVLADECDFCRAMFDRSLKSGEDSANLPTCDPEAVGLILHYLYTGEYLLEPTYAFYKWINSAIATQRALGVNFVPTTTNIQLHILAYQAAQTFGIQAVQEEIYNFFVTRGSSKLIHEDGLLEQLELLYEVTKDDEFCKLRAYVIHECLSFRSSLILSRPDVVSVIAEWDPEMVVTMYDSEIGQLKLREELLTEGNEAVISTLSEKVGRLEWTTKDLRDEVAFLKAQNVFLSTENREFKARQKSAKCDGESNSK